MFFSCFNKTVIRCHRRTLHGNIGSCMVSPRNEAFDELELFRNEIMYNTNFMFDLLIFKSQYLDIFTFPTLETLTEKSEECFSNDAKSLNLTDDNAKNRLSKFISSESTKDSSSMISFQMESNGERPVSQRTASRTSSLGAEVQITITDITNEHEHLQEDTTKMDEQSEKAGTPTHYLSPDDSTTYSSKEISKYSMSVTPKLDSAELEINNLFDKLLPTGSVDSRQSNSDSQQIADQNNLRSQSEQSSKQQSSSAETEPTSNENNLQETINSSFQILNDSPNSESQHSLKTQTPINVFQNTSLSSNRLSAQTNKEEELVEDIFKSPVLSEAQQTETGTQSQPSKHSEVPLPSESLESEILSLKSSVHSKQNMESEIIKNDNKSISSRPGSGLSEFIINTSDNSKMSPSGSQKSQPGSEKSQPRSQTGSQKSRPGSEKSRPGSRTSTKSTKSKTNSRPTSRNSVHSVTFQTGEIDLVHSPHNMKENVSRSESKHSEPENIVQTTQLDLSQPENESFNKEILTENIVKSLSRPESNKSKHSFDNKEYTETSPNISRVSSGKSITKLSTPLLNGHVYSPISSSPLNNALTQGNSPINSNNNTQTQGIDHITVTTMEEHQDDNIISPDEKEDSAISSTSISPERVQQNLEGQTPVQELIGVT